MEEMSLLDVAEAVQGELIAQEALSEVNPTGGSIDTRSLNPGEIFFALQGEQTNGHHFVNRAFSKGASVAVVSRSWYIEQSGEGPSGTLILTEAPDVALGELARVYRRRFKVPVVGITGSNGKTTTKDMAASVLKTRYRVLSTEGNLNTCLGVPLTILRFSTKHDVAVVNSPCVVYLVHKDNLSHKRAIKGVIESLEILKELNVDNSILNDYYRKLFIEIIKTGSYLKALASLIINPGRKNIILYLLNNLKHKLMYKLTINWN